MRVRRRDPSTGGLMPSPWAWAITLVIAVGAFVGLASFVAAVAVVLEIPEGVTTSYRTPRPEVSDIQVFSAFLIPIAGALAAGWVVRGALLGRRPRGPGSVRMGLHGSRRLSRLVHHSAGSRH